MSIGSIASNSWIPPFRQQPGAAGTWSTAPPTPPDTSVPQPTIAPWPSQSASGTGAQVTPPTSPFQQLSTDIQAILLQAQGASSTQTASATTAASTTGGTTAAATPEQQLATDVQTLLAQLQDGQSGSATSGQTASASQTGATTAAQPHHHHHHHHAASGEEGGDAVGAAGGTTPTTATSANTPPDASTSASAAPSSDRTVTQAFAANIMQALQVYGGTSSTGTGSGLMA